MINTYSGFEYQIKKDLINKITKKHLSKYLKYIFIPTIKIENFKKKIHINKKVFSGYILIKVHLNSKMWLLIKQTNKIIGFLGDSIAPFSLKKSDVENIWNMLNNYRIPPSDTFYQINNCVRINNGPFANFHGIIKNINMEKKTIKVALSILGRSTYINLNFIDIEKIYE